jgi:hypothetical protein
MCGHLPDFANAHGDGFLSSRTSFPGAPHKSILLPGNNLLALAPRPLVPSRRYLIAVFSASVPILTPVQSASMKDVVGDGKVSEEREPIEQNAEPCHL